MSSFVNVFYDRDYTAVSVTCSNILENRANNYVKIHRQTTNIYIIW